MKKVFVMLIAITMMFVGCSNATLEENSVLQKSDISSSPIDSALGSNLEISSYTDSGQHDTSEVATTEQVDIDGHELDGYGEEIFKGDGYSAPYPPYTQDWEVCTSIQEVENFIATTDGVNYKEGYYYSFLKMAREKGYIFEPFYNGESVFTGETHHGKYNKNGLCLNFEERIFGVGFRFQVETEKIQSDFYNSCTIYYLKDEWIEDAKEHPFNYAEGKPSELNTFEKAQKIGWKRKKMTINGEEKQVYFDTYQMNTNHPVAELVYFHEDCIVNIELSCQPEEYIFGVAENIRFEKIWL